MFKTGDTVNNRYVIRGVLSRKESTTVYLVSDSLTHRERVLKEFVIDIQNPHQMNISVKQFEKEITLLAGMDHPGIPEFSDHFVLGDRQYIVMECVHGRSLQEYLSKADRPLEEKTILQTGYQIAEVLEFLHNQSNPHIFRDLKPSNVMITPENRIKLLDFSLGRHFVNFKDSNRQGTRGYAPPEQFAQGTQDQKTDIYALGIILHQMATLTDPAQLSNVFFIKPVTQLNKKASRELEEIVSRATAYDRKNRYDSAAQLKEDLGALSQGKSEYFLRRHQDKKSRLEKREAEINLEANNAEAALIEKSKRNIKPRQSSPILLGIMVFLLVMLSGLGAAWYFGLVKDRDDGGDYKSPFALAQDKRTQEYRKNGIEHYKKGVTTGNMGELAKAAGNLSKAVSAHPMDTISQVYLENTRMLLKGKPYVKVAVILSLSGLDFESGTQMLGGLGLAQHIHNTRGKGKPILLEIYDDETVLEKAIQISAELAKRSDLLAVVAFNRTPFAANSAPLVNGAGIVFISPTGSVPDTEDLGELVFRTAGDGKNESVKIATLAVKDMGLKRIAVVYDPAQGFSNYQGKTFIKTANQLCPGCTGEFFISLDNPDYIKTVREIKNYNPDGIFFTGYQLHQAKFNRQAEIQGVKAVKLATLAVHTQQSINIAGRSIEGLIFYTLFVPDEARGEGKKFVEEFKNRFNVEPNFRAAFSYDSMLLISDGVSKGIEKPAELAAHIKNDISSGDNLEGATGYLKFDQYGRRKDLDTIIMQVKDGRFVKYEHR